ncbi:hypothetical protein HCBG_07364 [Histoplasma capsulatum G186AR]|uniref:Uncharacterized protein n=1 Tax=Ajellomyces capsulatus (strain G186AR / H82 / ATCC MYA-2454 / RMSCC 2432) TaxID=447093 RepID=C0NW34_AJECG|nr:uncharacterized protein HCBG_07364 [Histoplasma capsulatum G186AR]EEH04139.1 hypothetical protein HCBG_07364 [Histoplasma capsulatum G186AR]
MANTLTPLMKRHGKLSNDVDLANVTNPAAAVALWRTTLCQSVALTVAFIAQRDISSQLIMTTSNLHQDLIPRGSYIRHVPRTNSLFRTPRMKAYVIAPFGLKSTTDRCAAGSVRGITANIPSDLIFSWTRNLSLVIPASLLSYAFLSLLSHRYLFSCRVYYPISTWRS